MAEDAPNRKWWTYVDNHGKTWNKMGKIDPGCNAIDGSAAATVGAPNFPRQTRRYAARKAVFQDPATFRTAYCIMYTAAAGAALSGTSTLAVNVPGSATPVTYTFQELTPEKTPIKSISRNLAD